MKFPAVFLHENLTLSLTQPFRYQRFLFFLSPLYGLW